MTPEQLDQLGFQLSHDIKGSLRSLSLTLDLITKSAEANDLEQVKARIAIAKSTSKKLWKFLDGLMGLSMASRSIADERVDMRGLVLGAISEFQQVIDSQGIKIEVGNLISVMTDSSMIQEVWRQLIENAIWHGKPKLIKIGSENGLKNIIIFYIEDDGEPIAPEIASNLFSAILKSQADTENVGLGLLFCRRVIERLNGNIRYTRQNGLNRFSFQLPSQTL